MLFWIATYLFVGVVLSSISLCFHADTLGATMTKHYTKTRSEIGTTGAVCCYIAVVVVLLAWYALVWPFSLLKSVMRYA